MRAILRSLVLLVLLMMQNYLSAQEKLDLKFGKISPADFDLSGRKFDTSAGAVVLVDYGMSEFEGGNKGDLTINFTTHMRIKILNKNGFDAATFEVGLVRVGDREEKLANLKANTYNLEDGKVVVTKLEDKSVFKDKQNQYLSTRKFTMPAVKEGSIVEVTYTVKSDFSDHLRGWTFQGQYPVLWSEYIVRIPQFMDYVFLNQGFQPYYIKSSEQSFKSFSVVLSNDSRSSDFLTIGATINSFRWVMKDVPPLKKEEYITTLGNYVSKISFELSGLREPYPPRTILGTWLTVAANMMKRENFGEPLDKPNTWLDDDMKTIVAGSASQLDKAKKIYTYVRDNFTCTDHDATTLENTLKDVFKGRKGSVAEINLLLIAMFKHEGIQAEPILLSTRDNGYANEFYPLLHQFNYVIAGVNIDGNAYYLDATERKIGFTHLPLQCYNGSGRLINPAMPRLVSFTPDSLKETKVTAVFVVNDEKGKPTSSFKSTLGYYESVSLREKVAEKGKDQVMKDIQTEYPAETEVSELELDSLNDLEGPVQVRYNIDFNNFNEDIVYFNPMLAEGYKDNFFKSAERFYPVEMPFVFDEVYILNMEVPAGYVVDELPKSARVNLNDGDGAFEYLISQSGDRIMLRSRVKLNKAYFVPADYESLRGFFDHIVKKHAEMIVFKKKK